MAENEVELTLLRQLASRLAMPIWLVGSDGELLYYNGPAESILRRRFDEAGPVPGVDVATLFSARAEDGSRLEADDLPINIALTQRRPAHLPIRIRGLDGVWRRIEITAFPIEGQGRRHLGAVAIFWEAETAPVAPGGLVTILFTDIESSTALTQRLGDAKAQHLLRTHNTIVREALKANGGSEVKHMGDGIMASFPSASQALRCAASIQQAVAAQADTPLRVRVGLNAGEPVSEDQDLFGTAVQLAKRICDRAEPGQILAPIVVRELAAGKGFLFADIGEAELRGFEDPVRLYEVRWRD